MLENSSKVLTANEQKNPSFFLVSRSQTSIKDYSSKIAKLSNGRIYYLAMDKTADHP